MKYLKGKGVLNTNDKSLILFSKLSANHKFKDINTFAIPAVHYTAAIIHWPVSILRQLDR